MTLTLEVPEELDSDISGPTNVESIETVQNDQLAEMEPIDEKTGHQDRSGCTISGQVDPGHLPKPTTDETLISDGVAEWGCATSHIETEISDLTIEKARLAERAKSIKKRIDCLAEELQELRECGPRSIRRKGNTPLHGRPLDEDGAIDFDLPAIPLATDDAWRAAPLSDLHLKTNVHDKLTEAGISTIGQLEDLRADISNRKAKWPKGIGQAKITEVEDAVVAWLTKNRDAAEFQDALTRWETTDNEPAESSPAITTPKRNGFWPVPGAAVCSVDDL